MQWLAMQWPCPCQRGLPHAAYMCCLHVVRRFSPALEASTDTGGPGEGKAGTAPQPAELRAADDPDTQLILQLFPQHVAAAILAALAEAEEEAALVAAAAEAQEGQDGSGIGAGDSTTSSTTSRRGGGGTQLVEVIVDRGRPVRVRLSSRRDLQLDVQFSVEVGWGPRRVGG